MLVVRGWPCAVKSSSFVTREFIQCKSFPYLHGKIGKNACQLLHHDLNTMKLILDVVHNSDKSEIRMPNGRNDQFVAK